MYRTTLYLLSAWPCYWNGIVQHSIKQMGDNMEGRIVLLYFNCEDITGQYDTIVVIQKIGHMYVAHYCDFEEVTTISPTRRGLDVWLPVMLRTMLANESGIVPNVRFSHSELWEKEA